MKVLFMLAAAALMVGTAARPSIAQEAAPPVRHLTLDEAQRVPVQANAAMARLGQLSVEAAEHHRRAVAADYFPKVSATAWNLHFNEFMGQQINIVRPLVGTAVTAGVPLLGQDQSFVAFNAIQPLTPIFKVRQAVNLARADENIARGKAGLPVEESRHALTKSYFDLLIAQKQLALAEAKASRARAARLVASTAPSVVNARLDAEPADLADLTEDVVDLSSRVRTLTASLNDRLGWPADTPLELEAPAALIEHMTLVEAVEQALSTNPEVIEAEQNVQKARAGTKLSKLDYVPDIAVIGGFAAQQDFIPLLPNNFAYVGVFGTYNIFDFGKREQTVKERSTQLEMARTALDLTRGKVAAAVKTSYLELERSRTLFQLASARATGADIHVVRFGALEVRSDDDDDQIALEQIKLDWRHRQAYVDLKGAIGGR
jgi:outer membrane protein TolC